MMANASASPAPPRPKGLSPRMANLLHREPSQQELEAARQLVEHSQSVTMQAPAQDPQSSQTASNQNQTSTPFQHGYREASEYPSSTQGSPVVSLASAPIMQPSRTSPSAMSNMSTPGGQMCRYVPPKACFIVFYLTFSQQLWYHENASLEAIAGWCSDMQCMWSVLQSTKPDAASRAEAWCRDCGATFRWLN